METAVDPGGLDGGAGEDSLDEDGGDADALGAESLAGLVELFFAAPFCLVISPSESDDREFDTSDEDEEETVVVRQFRDSGIHGKTGTRGASPSVRALMRRFRPLCFFCLFCCDCEVMLLVLWWVT